LFFLIYYGKAEQDDGAALPQGVHCRAEDTLEDAFRRRYSGFRPANDDEITATAA